MLFTIKLKWINGILETSSWPAVRSPSGVRWSLLSVGTHLQKSLHTIFRLNSTRSKERSLYKIGERCSDAIILKNEDGIRRLISELGL